MIEVTGSLQIKNNIYQAVLSYKQDGKWKTKWVSTKIKALKQNKKLAEKKLYEIKINFQAEINNTNSTDNTQNGDILFIDFMKNWLKMIRPSIEESTYCSYWKTINGKINNYFGKNAITLQNLKSKDIQDFYQYLINLGLSGNTVSHYHANIRKALQYAVKTEIIPYNPADRVELPKIIPYKSTYYTREEIQKLFQIVKGTKLETPVLLASFYGLRRSEVIGLKWNAIDFTNKTISIEHVVIQMSESHTMKIVRKDRTKNKSSTRLLPLLPEIEAYLGKIKAMQGKYKSVCKKNYNNNFLDYVCVDKIGNLLTPNYITRTFRKILIKNNLKVIRFHDLRHSVASLLLNEGIGMKQIQMWLGHSNYSTTANIYAHLDTNSMQQSANVISSVLNEKKSLCY